ncbi:MAG: outer membrane protein TolC [Bacteroidia bacterium]|jgi:outer membrane protein TolC
MIRNNRIKKLATLELRFLPSLLLSILWSFAFNTLSAQNLHADSSVVLNYNDFIDLVLLEHPVSKQADLQIEKGKAAVMAARGGFDPKLTSTFNQKQFENIHYYTYSESNLSVNTPFGLEVKTGFEQNSGAYINPENTTPMGGLVKIGVSLPIGRGLFIDGERTERNLALLYEENTDFQRSLIRNTLVLEAGMSYWKWFNAHHVLKSYQEAYSAARFRFEGVRREVILGDRAAIDSVEANIQLNQRLVMLESALNNLENAKREVAAFLWVNDQPDLTHLNQIQPMSQESILMVSNYLYRSQKIDSNLSMHPYFLQLQNKMAQLEVQVRWKKEQLKPNLNINYNAINEPVGNQMIAGFSPNNYMVGLQFSTSLFLRKERGELQLAKLKLQETALELDNFSYNIYNSALIAINNLKLAEEQLQTSSQILMDYEILLNAERRLFFAGESSLFLVNMREQGYINAQVKQLEWLSKKEQSLLYAAYAMGVLGSE